LKKKKKDSKGLNCGSSIQANNLQQGNVYQCPSGCLSGTLKGTNFYTLDSSYFFFNVFFSL